MALATKLVQLRLPPELYEALAQEVQRRKAAGQSASLAAVATECVAARLCPGEDKPRSRRKESL